MSISTASRLLFTIGVYLKCAGYGEVLCGGGDIDSVPRCSAVVGAWHAIAEWHWQAREG